MAGSSPGNSLKRKQLKGERNRSRECCGNNGERSILGRAKCLELEAQDLPTQSTVVDLSSSHPGPQDPAKKGTGNHLRRFADVRGSVQKFWVNCVVPKWTIIYICSRCSGYMRPRNIIE